MLSFTFDTFLFFELKKKHNGKQAINVVSHPGGEAVSSSLLGAVVRGTFQGAGQGVHPVGEERGRVDGESEANSIGSEESLELVTDFCGSHFSGVLERQRKREV